MFNSMGALKEYNDAFDSNPRSIYRLGTVATDVVSTSLFRHGNFDHVNNSVVWSPAVSSRTVPEPKQLTYSARPLTRPRHGLTTWVA